jgi:hypothetical protein
MSFPFGITVVFQTLGQDRFGNRTVTGTQSVAGCAFAPGASSEQDNAQDEVIEQGTVYAPFGTNVTAYNQAVTPDGLVWEIQGTPSSWENPFTGWQAGVAIPLKRTVG